MLNEKRTVFQEDLRTVKSGKQPQVLNICRQGMVEKDSYYLFIVTQPSQTMWLIGPYTTDSR